jgi:hypothetical protein
MQALTRTHNTLQTAYQSSSLSPPLPVAFVVAFAFASAVACSFVVIPQGSAVALQVSTAIPSAAQNPLLHLPLQVHAVILTLTVAKWEEP